MTQLRHELHRDPEIGLDLPRTQAKVLDALEDLPLEISTGTSCTSVTAVLRGTGGAAGPAPAVLLRGDMDALPVQEETGVAFASTVGGAMHACGHDAHVAILMGVAEILAEYRAELTGTVKLLFQPNEEGFEGRPSGAQAMIDQGALADPVPSAIFGLHVTSAQTSG